MAGLVLAIHAFATGNKDVDARIRGHDAKRYAAAAAAAALAAPSSTAISP
jgi:hypothetical protein